MKYVSKPRQLTVTLLAALLVTSLTACSMLSSQLDEPGVSITDPNASNSSSPTRPDDSSTEPASTTTIPSETPPATTVPRNPDIIPEPLPQVNKVSFLAAGDNLIHSYIYLDSKDDTEEDGYNFLPIYSRVADMIAEADIAYVNQETMMDDTQRYSGYPRFNTPEAMANDLAALGFDIASVGNNHTLDRGTAAVVNTIDKLNSVGITTIGAYKSAEDEANIRVVTKNGIRIALLNYTYGTNVGHDGRTSVRVPIISDSKMISDLEKANEIADFTMVFVHWGNENQYQYNSEQARVAKLLAENGAGIIIGTHPHVIQSIEWLDDGKGGSVLCAYSLGNLVSTMAHDFNMMAGLLTFDIVMTEGDAKAHIENPLLTPTAFYYSGGYDEMYLMYLQDFTDEMEQTHGVYQVYDRVIDNELLISKYKQYIANEFRIELFRDE